jgi:histone acetyltransferase (RNA polymerase elongator complex component)
MPAPPYVVPVFIPHAGCPHRCVFCDQRAITGDRRETPDPEAVLTEWLSRPRNPDRPVQLAFYGGNFLGLPRNQFQSLLDFAGNAVSGGPVESIRFSTRPDTVLPGRLNRLENLPISVVELGAQSLDDSVLEATRRGHTAEDTETAVERLRARNLPAGLQLMVGLPGETRENLRETARRALALRPAMVRIYAALVLRGSRLETWMEAGRYAPLSLAEAEERAAILFRTFSEAGIPVVRMGLQAGPDLEAALVAGPYHPAFGYRVRSAVFRERAAEALSAAGPLPERIGLAVNPRRESELRGPGNRNIEILRRMFHSTDLTVLRDPALPDDQVAVRAVPSDTVADAPATPSPHQPRPTTPV